MTRWRETLPGGVVAAQWTLAPLTEVRILAGQPQSEERPDDEGVREVPDNNVYGYTLRDDFDRVVYVGITNNPRARRAEHLLDGKRFAELKIETKPMSRHEAYEWEKRSISDFFVCVGRRPKYNKNFGGNPTTYTAPPRTITKRPPARSLTNAAAVPQPVAKRPSVRERRPARSTWVRMGVVVLVGLLLLTFARVLGESPSNNVDALQQWDDNENGRITCAEARHHDIAPVRRGHPAYPYMKDLDNDGIVCE